MRKSLDFETATAEQLERLTLPKIEQIAREAIAHAQKILRRSSELPSEIHGQLHRIRNAYNEILEGRTRQIDGDAEIFAGFKQVLGEVLRPKQAGRHWGTYRSYLREGDNPRNTNRNFHGKP